MKLYVKLFLAVINAFGLIFSVFTTIFLIVMLAQFFDHGKTDYPLFIAPLLVVWFFFGIFLFKLKYERVQRWAPWLPE